MLNRIRPGNNLELIKWAAVILMIIDHINKYLFNWTIPGCFAVGRLAMPLFAFVLATHLASPRFTQESYTRLWRKLAIFGILATPFFISLGGVKGVLPFNIMFTLLVSSVTIYLLQKQRLALAITVFVSTGLFVEFMWFGAAVTIAAWYCVKSDYSPLGIATLLAAVAALGYINGNHYALAAIPIFYWLTHRQWPIKRIPFFFYAFYPSHLALLLLVRIPMAGAGYLFFI